jgi:ParB/RepB/Spo0J family partition protein
VRADETLDILVSLLDEPFLPLRPVLKDSVEYLERRASIESSGFLNSILVRPSPRSPGRYEIIDGMWRFSVAVDIGRETIPCIIKYGLSDNDVLALQIQANEVTKSTKPTEVARHLHRMMQRMPGVTAGQLSRLISKHPTYVKDRLGLLELNQEAQLMVDRGEIPAKSAYMLAKIPHRWRKDHVDNARTMTCKEFCALAAGIIKQFTECVQQGRMVERYLPEFKPQAFQRSISEVKGELDNPTVGATLLVTEGCHSPLDGFNAGLRWTLHLDRQSIEEQKVKAQARQHKDILTQLENGYEPLPE